MNVVDLFDYKELFCFYIFVFLLYFRNYMWLYGMELEIIIDSKILDVWLRLNLGY